MYLRVYASLPERFQFDYLVVAHLANRSTEKEQREKKLLEINSNSIGYFIILFRLKSVLLDSNVCFWHWFKQLMVNFITFIKYKTMIIQFWILFCFPLSKHYFNYRTFALRAFLSNKDQKKVHVRTGVSAFIYFFIFMIVANLPKPIVLSFIKAYTLLLKLLRLFNMPTLFSRSNLFLLQEFD